MIEIRFHGRGGQGAVTAAEILAKAAFEDGKYSQAFPFFGVERRGAPVMAFTRINDEPIRRRYQVYNPDYVVVLDEGLVDVVDVFSGLKEDGVVLLNTAGTFTSENAKIHTIDATGIALENLGRPIVNTVMLGAFAGVTGLVSIDSLIKIIKETFPGKIGDKNAEAARIAYEKMKHSG
ncbi:pyruvate ferredoxin oxidoreductase subunit gamma [Methanothermobacter marburgensis]|uniref:Pyruvate synthase subunit PorC n=1 Tax=Methanothermobacter marburgensis (strain ATCC BAA-927 / DSM 2133 / JCM 14651 / NBRC 100331 / OCM 82 / Marburg) TaxID=79929 RepID=PORC_METTM|nr:pyruvate synthase subunit PorC [Methanothermobacter marburgensis]P80902.2 RecName: Full=Pyruvate synthase subunit PorC; AltName: Full=Pyruvate oxidoreductase gamma chain; Short=POR; AltName: Full=Pyruvic-ferredoxin oxidoreductase subunit gamma [Methanothermobacter marburgensis str. Marburg]ADL57922.1 pyruvate synthase, subunit C [Methanothermobacter marburgensis str. Marburg]WBF10124.1 pyruvate ferredoxin oxidoreductase subunit gamma [Methanothermobacter marburgensis]